MIVRAFLKVSLAFGLAALAVELTLNLFPVNTGLLRTPLLDPESVVRNVPGTRFTYSKGWNFRNSIQGRINGAGFLSDREYLPATPNIAVVGDSYVEAQMIATGDRLSDQLQVALGGAPEVYGFGRAGADLGEYLALSKWIAREFHPEVLVFLINDGDLTGATYGARGDHYFRIADGNCVLESTPRAESRLHNVLRQSKLFDYLLYNLDLAQWYMLNIAKKLDVPQPSAAMAPALNRQALDCFLTRITQVTGLPSKRIYFLIDPARDAIYDKRPQPVRDTDVLAQVAESKDFPVVRLLGAFEAEYRDTQQRLDFLPIDGHWNPKGHRLAAQTLAERMKRDGSLGR